MVKEEMSEECSDGVPSSITTEKELCINLFPCSNCGMKFLSQENLEKHLKNITRCVHNITLENECFLTKYFVNKHMKNINKKSTGIREDRECKLCRKILPSETLWMRHKFYHRRGFHKCTVCSHFCLYKSILTQHKKAHRFKKFHICFMCKKKCSWRYQLSPFIYKDVNVKICKKCEIDLKPVKTLAHNEHNATLTTPYDQNDEDSGLLLPKIENVFSMADFSPFSEDESSVSTKFIKEELSNDSRIIPVSEQLVNSDEEMGTGVSTNRNAIRNRFCFKCHKVFTSIEDFNCHMEGRNCFAELISANFKKAFEKICIICKKKFASPSDFNEHVKLGNCKIEYKKCPICFANILLEGFAQHLLDHSSEPSVKYKTTRRKYISEVEFIETEVISQNKTYPNCQQLLKIQCTVCHIWFFDQNKLKRNHKISPVCEKCKQFQNNENFQKQGYFNLQHRQFWNQKSFICHHCPKVNFTTLKDLEIHLKSHSGEIKEFYDENTLKEFMMCGENAELVSSENHINEFKQDNIHKEITKLEVS